MENINDYQKQIIEHLKTISVALVDISKSLKTEVRGYNNDSMKYTISEILYLIYKKP